MKVLVSALSRNLGPTGVCRFAANLCKGIKEFGEPVLIVGCWQKDYFESCYELNHNKIQICTVDISNRSVSRNQWYIRGLPEVCRQMSPNIVHVSFPIPLPRRSMRAKVVGTVHDLYPFDVPENFGFPNYLLNRAAFKSFVSSVNAVTCVSETTRDRFAALFPAQWERLRPEVIHNSISPVPFSTPPRWLNPSARYFLCVAQHRKNKNLARLIQAFAQARPNMASPAQLYIVGEAGPETDRLYEVVRKLGMERVVEFHSALAEAELVHLYRNALALLSPSLFEGFGLPPLEAAQYGCPVLVSDIPVFRETAPDQMFVDPTDVPAMRTAIVKLSKGVRSEPANLQTYDPGYLSNRYRTLYRSLLN